MASPEQELNNTQAPEPAEVQETPDLSDARTVGYEEALAFFDARRPTYLRLVHSIERFVKPTGVVFDVGANMGYFTKTLSEELSFTGTIHLFEPVPNLAKLCRQTVAGAGFAAAVHEFGLSDTDGAFDIYVASDGNLGWNTMVEEKSEGMSKVRIEVRTLGGSGVTDVPDFVKIDVEGAEARVLRGMLDAIETWPTRPAILCEIGWGVDHPQWVEELAVLDELKALGYVALDLNHNPVVVEELTKTTDLIFVPQLLGDLIKVEKELAAARKDAARAEAALRKLEAELAARPEPVPVFSREGIRRAVQWRWTHLKNQLRRRLERFRN